MSVIINRGMNINLAYSLSVFVEAFIHGIYTILFFSAMPIMLKNRSHRPALRKIPAIWLFPVATMLMYTISSLHVALSFYRFFRAYILGLEPAGQGWQYFWQFSRWDALANSILVCFMTWLGDAVVIYRCYCIWSGNISLIVIPVLLLCASVADNIFVLVWFTHEGSYKPKAEIQTLNAIYPISLAQNVITTGLIAFKIWNQHRVSSAHGVVDRSSRLSLIKIFRIIIESAMIYTIQLFILVLLFFRNDTFQYIVQCAIVPSIGIVFVMIALRVHHAKIQDPENGNSLGVIPSAWLSNSDSGVDFSQQETGSIDATFPVTEIKSEGGVAADDDTFPPPHKRHLSQTGVNLQ